MSATYARELLSLGIPPRAVMHLVLEDVAATLSEWTADVLTCDELELVRQAKQHIENAEHCMLMLLRPSEALCEPHYPLHELETIAPPEPETLKRTCVVCGYPVEAGVASGHAQDCLVGFLLDTNKPPLSSQKEPPESAGTDRAVDEPATAKKPYSPPSLSHLPPDDPRVAAFGREVNVRLFVATDLERVRMSIFYGINLVQASLGFCPLAFIDHWAIGVKVRVQATAVEEP